MKASQKKALGLYYTPSPLARALINWLITSPNMTVFDPCFGRGSFLYNALERLESLGTRLPGRFVFGVDIDPEATSYLQPLIAYGASETQFLTSDFLAVDPESLPRSPYRAVVGNPPFVRHNLIPKDGLKRAKNAVERHGISLSGRPSYWVYFLIHCLSFLQRGGRLAMILPHSLIQADYAREVRKYVFERFRRVTLIELNGRAFRDAEQSIVVLLGDGFALPNTTTEIVPNTGLTGLARLTSHVSSAHSVPAVLWSDEWMLSLLKKETRNIYTSLIRNPRVTCLGHWVNVRIGTVTGANHFFVMRRSEAESHGIPERFLRGIISSSTVLPGLEFTGEDLKELVARDEPCKLLDVRNHDLCPSLESYLAKGEAEGIPHAFKCRTRNPWYHVPNAYAPDAFFHYMTSSLPHLVLNRAGITCTNAVHRLTWKKISAADSFALALATVSSLCQLSAELAGRSYGGGVLKMEPTKLASISVCVPCASRETIDTFEQIDELLRRGKKDEAVAFADDVVLKEFLGLPSNQVALLHDGWTHLRIRRQNRRKLIDSHP